MSLSLSIALHATVVLGLLELLDPAPDGAQHVIDVKLTGFDTEAVAEQRDRPGRQPDAPVEPSDAANLETPAELPVETEPAAAERRRADATLPETPSVAIAPAEPPPEPIDFPAPPPAAPLEDVRLEIAGTVPPAPQPAPPPVVTTIEMATAHADLLTEHAASWAAELDAATLPADTLLETADGERFEVAFAREPPSDDMDLERVVARISTTRDGTPLVAELHLTRLAFSSFAQLVDRWDPNVQIHDDEIDGRFHANSEIHVSRSGGVQPTFHGKVTTSRGINTSSSRQRIRRNEVFLGGLETRAPRIFLPSELAATAGEHVHRFDRDMRISFRDGAYSYAALDDDEGPQGSARLPDAPLYLIAGDDAELHVSGTVDGRVLVYSPEAVVVTGDLVYASDPFGDAQADDYLGLASERIVEIAPPSVTGRGDLRVQAAIYAKRRFAVRHYRSRNDGTLFIDGSVTAGSLTATEPRFRTKLRFDPRFERTRPPGFPVTDRYELTTQNAVWRTAQ